MRDGQFEFTVTKVEQGSTEVGSGWSQKTAQGEFVIITVKVTNTGKAQRTFWNDEQVLIDDQDRRFTATPGAHRLFPNNGDSLGDDLNPGFAIERIILFDVPAGTPSVTLELHDSPFSGGVKVALR